jgi:arylsulfatase A-like enzyme
LSAAGSTTDRPNIILIISDTFRRDHIGAYGNTWIRTPNLDHLASRSVVFDHHLIAGFPTVPARADILTGTFSYAYMGWEPLPQERITLPEYLSAAGYLTMGVVDVPFYIRRGWDYDRGFDDFEWVRGQGAAGFTWHERLDSRMTWISEADRIAVRTLTAADAWLERHYKERFFLYIDMWDPHEPWNAPAHYTELYEPTYDGREIPPVYGNWQAAGVSEDDLRTAHATYCGEVTMVDRWIGHLLSKIDVLGLADKTYILFLSDHGYYFGEHGYFGKAVWSADDPTAKALTTIEVPKWFDDARFLNAGWSPLYQELTRAPLIVRGPGLAPGRRKALTTAPDIPATILELAGEPIPEVMQGSSFAPALRGNQEEHREFVVSSWPLYFAEGEITSAVDDTPRLLSSYMPITISTRTHSVILGGPVERPELYDLETDPGEERNVWNEHLEEGIELCRRAVAFLEECQAPDRYLEPRKQALARLAAQGPD